MTMHSFTATFADGTSSSRTYARTLTHAYRVVFAYTTAPDGAEHVKIAFAGSLAAAEKAVKLPKRYVVKSFEIVEAVDAGELPAKLKTTKPKKVAAFTEGEAVTLTLGGVQIEGSIAKIGRAYVFVTISGAIDPVKVAFAAIINKPAPSDILALAA